MCGPPTACVDAALPVIAGYSKLVRLPPTCFSLIFSGVPAPKRTGKRFEPSGFGGVSVDAFLIYIFNRGERGVLPLLASCAPHWMEDEYWACPSPWIGDRRALT